MLNWLIDLENKLILEAIQKEPLSVDIQRVSERAHISVVNGLIKNYLKREAKDYEKIFSFCFENSDLAIDIEHISEIENISALCEQLHILFLNTRFSITRSGISRGKSKHNAIETGSVYTREDISYLIVESTLNNPRIILPKAKILDFACGTGRFYDAIINYLGGTGIDPKRAVSNNVFAIDIDPVAVNITRLKAFEYYGEVNFGIASIINNNILLRNALVKNGSCDMVNNGIQQDDFGGLAIHGFDAIVSNPPYLVLKPSKNKFSEEAATQTVNLVTYFRTSGNFEYSIEGMLNYYQISIEVMLQMLKNRGELGVICPATLFADVTATKLRKHLFLKNKVRSIRYYPENEPIFINVTQATCIFHLTKGAKTEYINIHSNGTAFSIGFERIQRMFGTHFEVPYISDYGWSILTKLSRCAKLGSIETLRNKRGELDLTQNKKYITKTPTKYRLIRGSMLSKGYINYENNEFVHEDFISIKSADYMNFDFGKKRLVCQQISNTASKKRLKFMYCKKTDILGNSCNYLSSDETTLAKLHLLLNSSLLNWRFKITSSNNHVNNYELNELPIIDLTRVDEKFTWASMDELDKYVGALYGLTDEEINYITRYDAII